MSARSCCADWRLSPNLCTKRLCFRKCGSKCVLFILCVAKPMTRAQISVRRSLLALLTTVRNAICDDSAICRATRLRCKRSDFIMACVMMHKLSLIYSSVCHRLVIIIGHDICENAHIRITIGATVHNYVSTNSTRCTISLLVVQACGQKLSIVEQLS